MLSLKYLFNIQVEMLNGGIGYTCLKLKREMWTRYLDVGAINMWLVFKERKNLKDCTYSSVTFFFITTGLRTK